MVGLAATCKALEGLPDDRAADLPGLIAAILRDAGRDRPGLLVSTAETKCVAATEQRCIRWRDDKGPARGPSHLWSAGLLLAGVGPGRAVRQAEVTAAKRMIERIEQRFDLYPGAAGRRRRLWISEMLGWLVHERGIEPHVPVFDKSQRTDGTFSRADFTYDHQGDVYVCPGGKILTCKGTVVNDHQLLYRASTYDCDVCRLKQRCCPKERRLGSPTAEALQRHIEGILFDTRCLGGKPQLLQRLDPDADLVRGLTDRIRCRDRAIDQRAETTDRRSANQRTAERANAGAQQFRLAAEPLEPARGALARALDALQALLAALADRDQLGLDLAAALDRETDGVGVGASGHSSGISRLARASRRRTAGHLRGHAAASGMRLIDDQLSAGSDGDN